MSRCFPFPPPGYEKKPRSSEHGDLLAKEKHKEKKHKKEKKNKEKGESKERKDRSKDKHNEKKERKEKHRDKKKDRDRDKDKNKTSEDQRTNHQSEVQHEGKLGNDSWKSAEIRDSKFTEELGRRIRDEEQKTANRMVEEFSASTQRRIGSMGASPAMGKESVTGNRMVTDVTGTVQRRNEKLAPSFQKRADGLETATIADRHKVTNSEKGPHLISAERRRNDNLTPPVQKKIESMGTTMAMEKQRAASKQKSEDFTSAEQRRNQVTGCLVENFSSSVERRAEGMGTVNSMQKERRIESIGAAPVMEKEKSGFPSTISIEQRRIDGIGVPGEKERSVEKDAHKKMEGKEKTKEEKAEDGKREGHKDKDRNEKKRKEKDKDRHKEKKKEEKKRGKDERKHRKHDKLRASGMKDQVDSLNNKNLSPHIEDVNNGDVDGNNKKRKEFEINGFLHEPQHDERPKKLPKMSASSSHTSLENGSLELIFVASPCPSRKFGAINNTERSLGSNNNHISGKVEVEPLHSLGPLTTAAVDLRKSDELHVLRPEVSSFAMGSSKSDEVLVPPVSQIAVNLSKSLDTRGAQVVANSSKGLVAPVAANSSKSLDTRGPQVVANSSKGLVAPVAANSSKSLVPPVASHLSKINQLPSKPPHPDDKYLSSIYSIPKIEDLLEHEDQQEWLFSIEKPKSNVKLEDDAIPSQVWAKGVQIDAADVFALPYVIPF